MSNSVSFKNADQVIEKFGGIRPFASKLGVPVTTVQGWKKRNSIPETRWNEITKLARELNLNLSDTNDNQPAATAPNTVSSPATAPIAAPSRPDRAAPVVEKEKVVYKRGYSAAQGILVTGVSVGLSVAILAVLFGPDFIVSNPAQRLSALEQKVGTGQAVAGGEINSDLASTLQQGQKALEDTINNTVMPRLNELQATLGDPQALAQLSANLKTMQESAEGQATLNAAVTELQTIVKGLQGDVSELDVALAAAQKENGALAETIGKVSTSDLTAAAMLLALNQFRTSIDRQEPLADDIALLKSVINPDENPDLAASLDRLAPFATSGVMSAGGLQTELSGVAGAIVEARLKGDNVPVQDIVRARLQNMFDVRNNGVPVLGTTEQVAVAKAQQQLAAGDIAAAKATLEALPAPSRQAAEPVIQKAEQTLAAQQVESQVTRYFSRSLQGLHSEAATAVNKPAAPAVTAPTSVTGNLPSAPMAEVPPSTGIAPITPAEEPEILKTAPVTPAAPSAAQPPSAAAPATPEGATPAPEAPSL